MEGQSKEIISEKKEIRGSLLKETIHISKEIRSQQELEREVKEIIIYLKEILIESREYRGRRTEGDLIKPKEIRSLPKEMEGGQPKQEIVNQPSKIRSLQDPPSLFESTLESALKSGLISSNLTQICP